MKKTIRILLCAALLLSLCTGALASGKVIGTGNTRIRTDASLKGKTLQFVETGDKLEYAGNSMKDDRGIRWYAVFCDDGEVGWISSQYSKLKENKYQGDTTTYIQATASTNLRSSRDKDDPDNIVGGMAKGDKLEYLDVRKKDERGVYWYKVRTKKGKTAWVSEKYTKRVEVEEDRVVIADCGNTKIRKQPDLDSKSVGTLSKGKQAMYLNRSMIDERGVRWYKISYKDTTGWVSYRYTTLSGK